MVGSRADRAGHARKNRQGRTVDMAAADKLDPGMALNDFGQRARIAKILAIHVRYAGQEGWVVQKQQRRALAA